MCHILRQSEAAKSEDSKLECADQGRKPDSRKPQIWKLQRRLPQTQNVKPYEHWTLHLCQTCRILRLPQAIRKSEETAVAKWECPDLGTLHLLHNMSHFDPVRSRKNWGRKVGMCWLRKQTVGSCKDSSRNLGMSWVRKLEPYIFCLRTQNLRKKRRQSEVAKLEAAKTVAAKSEGPALGTLNLTSFAQHVVFCTL